MRDPEVSAAKCGRAVAPSLPVRFFGGAAVLGEAFKHVPEAPRRGLEALKRIDDAFEFGMFSQGLDTTEEIGASLFDGAADTADVKFQALRDVEYFAVHLFLHIQHMEESVFRRTFRLHNLPSDGGQNF